jgi:hypothetical protein
MTISIWGWGATQISTWGWGSWVYEYVPTLLAEYIESHAHSCVIDTCGCITVTELSTSQVVMRLRPCDIPARTRGEVLIRSGGWPHEKEPCLDDEQ